MIFRVKHKWTGEIRIGQWDSEYLNFLSDSGNIDWMEYEHWEPYEMPVMKLKTTKFDTILSIHNPWFFVDATIYDLNGERFDTKIPFRMVNFNDQYIRLEPIYGRIIFDKTSFHGKVHGQDLRVHQMTEWMSTEYVGAFMALEGRICHSCLGFKSGICPDC